MKKGISITFSFALVLFLAMPLLTNAYSKGFEFNFAHALYGKTKHTLANKSTSVTLTSDTYLLDGSINYNKAEYSVKLSKFLKDYVTGTTANGGTTTKSFGVIASGTYKLNFNKMTADAYLERIKGSGTLKQ